jgi:hypothetical protein
MASKGHASPATAQAAVHLYPPHRSATSVAPFMDVSRRRASTRGASGELDLVFHAGYPSGVGKIDGIGEIAWGDNLQGLVKRAPCYPCRRMWRRGASGSRRHTPPHNTCNAKSMQTCPRYHCERFYEAIFHQRQNGDCFGPKLVLSATKERASMTFGSLHTDFSLPGTGIVWMNYLRGQN